MAQDIGGLERLLEDLVRRAVRDAIAQAGISSGGASSSPAPVSSASTGSQLPQVNQAVARLLQPTGQTEIMGAILQTAAGFSGRCALFVRRGDAFAFWRGEGFAPETTSRLKSVSVAANQSGAFKEAAENLLAVSGTRTADVVPSEMVKALADAADDGMFLFPIVVQGRAVATLYADSGSRAGSVEPSALEILARVTGLSLETAGGRATASAAPPVEAQAEPASPAEAPEGTPEVAPPPPPPPPTPPPSSEPVAAPAIPPPPELDSLPEGDRDSHKKAYRSARVAVQDLLAYPQNQEKIAEGRKNNTLYRMLKEEIDKNRETYQKRYGKTPAHSYDYLHFELVTKLAENNPEVLGPDYPGEMVG